MPVFIDPEEFVGRVALVTAAAGGGIGQATASRLAAGGATVVVTDSHERRTGVVVEELRERYGRQRVHGEVLDCGDMGNIERVIEAVTRHVGPITILVNNAALNIVAPVWEYELADWRRVMAVNIDGPWYLCRLTMPIMRAEGGGVIVNIGSYAPDVGGAGIEAPYAASKGALSALTRGFAHEGGPYGIRANYVAMGLVRGTRFVDRHPELVERPDSLGPLGSLPHVSDVAETVAFLAGERAAYITGEIVKCRAVPTCVPERDPPHGARRVGATPLAVPSVVPLAHQASGATRSMYSVLGRFGARGQASCRSASSRPCAVARARRDRRAGAGAARSRW